MDKRCSKCDELKPPTEYYTYFHSTQNTHRTRNICNRCMSLQKKKYRESIKERIIVQPVVLELEIEPIIDYSTNPDYKQCSTCYEFKLLDEFYNSKQSREGKYYRHAACKECSRTKENQKRKEERLELLEEQGGSERIMAYPNEYTDEFQKKFTFELLDSFGWIFNEEKEIWYKPGIKDENGIWNNIKNKPRRTECNRQTRFARSDIRKRITPDTLPTITISPSRVTSGITTEVVNSMMYDFFINNIKLKDLQKKYNYDYQMIGYYVDKIYKLF